MLTSLAMASVVPDGTDVTDDIAKTGADAWETCGYYMTLHHFCRRAAAAFADPLFVAIVVAATWLALSPASAEKRVALVIGNSTYRNVTSLANPRNDAQDISAALTRLGFDTTTGIDADREQMEQVIDAFAAKIEGADVALFYYAGHGMQYQGINYLIPTDADLSKPAGLRRLTKLNDVVADVKKAKALRILVLDACRDNPLSDILDQQAAAGGAGRGRSIGLAKLARSTQQPGSSSAEASAGGDIVVYAAEAGQTAADGVGRNSPFTAAVLRNIETEGQEIVSLMRRVATSVQQETGGAQRPELLLSVPFEFYFKVGAPQPPPTVLQIVPQAKQHEVDAIEAQIRQIIESPSTKDRDQARREILALLSDIASRSALKPAQIISELPKAYERLIQMRAEIAQFRTLMENEPEIAPFIEIAAAAVASGRRPDLKAADEALAQAQARYDETVRARTTALARAKGNRAGLLEQRGRIAETEARSKEAAQFYLAAAADTPEGEPDAAGRRYAMAGGALFVHGINFFSNDTLRDAIRILETEALKRFEAAPSASDEMKSRMAASSALVLAQIADAQTALGGRLPGIDGARMMVDARATYGSALKRIKVEEFPGIAMDILDRRSQRDLEFGRRITKDQGRGHFAEAVKTMRLILSVQQGKPAFEDQMARTLNNLANALKELSIRTEGVDGDRQIDEAISLFARSAEVLERQHDGTNSIIARLNLAHSLSLKAGRMEGLSGFEHIKRAQGLFSAVAAELERNKNPRLLAILNQHQAEMMRLVGQRRPERNLAFDDFKNAFVTYQKTLQVIAKDAAPNNWAMICAEMGYTLVAALPLMSEGDRKRSGQNAIDLFEAARPYFVAGGFGQDLEKLNAAAQTARGAIAP